MLITSAGLDFEQGSFNQLSINATLAISFLYLQRNPGTIVLISIACFRLTLYCTFHRDQKPPAIQTFNVQERLRLECGEAGSKGNHEEVINLPTANRTSKTNCVTRECSDNILILYCRNRNSNMAATRRLGRYPISHSIMTLYFD